MRDRDMQAALGRDGAPKGRVGVRTKWLADLKVLFAYVVALVLVTGIGTVLGQLLVA